MRHALLPLALLLVSACSGPVGPVGEAGPVGPSGSLPVGGVVLDGLVISHDYADDAAGKNGVVHVRARGVQVGSALAAVNDDVDMTKSGPGGLDSGIPATADTWYAVLVVTTGGANGRGMLTTTPESPTLPSGWQARRVGWARWIYGTNTKFLSFRQSGREVTFLPDVGIASRTILAGRDVKTAELADGQAPSGTGSEKDIALLVPPDVMRIRVRTTIVDPAGGSTADVFWGQSATDTEPLASCGNSATVGGDVRCSMESTISLREPDRRIYYGMSMTGTGAITYSLILAGYTDEAL